MVEFALILPMLLILILGIVEFGRLMVTISSVSTGSRDAARYGASVGETAAGVPRYQDCLGIRGAAQRVSLFTAPTIVITYDQDGPGGASSVEYCQVGKTVDSIQVSLGAQIRVSVTANYAPMLPVVNLPTMPVNSETARTVLRDLYVK